MVKLVGFSDTSSPPPIRSATDDHVTPRKYESTYGGSTVSELGVIHKESTASKKEKEYVSIFAAKDKKKAEFLERLETPPPVPTEEYTRQVSSIFEKARLKRMLASGFRRLSYSPRFMVLAYSLTVYALFGDDFRLAVTHKSMDVFFDIVTFICIFVFTIEVVANCFAKSDYIFSFFFWLDVLPTGTLLLDLTFVADALFCNNIEGGSALKSGRAGRAGARASRTVRIIRLIRLVKVYKLYVSAVEQRERKKRLSAFSNAPGEDQPFPSRKSTLSSIGKSARMSSMDFNQSDDDDELRSVDNWDDGFTPSPSKRVSSRVRNTITMQQIAVENKKKEKETRVGKKLSEMTTRRVIILVLVMLFSLPMFQPGTYGYEDLKTSASLGVEIVYQRWRDWCPFDNMDMPSCLRLDQFVGSSFKAAPNSDAARYWYERYFLTFLYTHHESHFAWKLYWAGLRSTKLAALLGSEGEAHLRMGLIAQLSQTVFLGNYSLPLSSWDMVFAKDDWVQAVAKLSSQVKQRLVSPWKQVCKEFVGVAVTSAPVADGATCTLDDDLRCSEMEPYSPMSKTFQEADGVQFLFVFSKKTSTKLEAALSMIQTVCICLAVGVGAMTFANDANQLLLHPIERMMAKIETIKDNPMQATHLGDIEFRRLQVVHERQREMYRKANALTRCWYRCKQKQKLQEPLETLILEKSIIQLGGLLGLCFGEEGGEVIASYLKEGNPDSVDIMVAGKKIEAMIACCQVRNVLPLTEALDADVLMFVNEICEILHGTVDEFSGAANKNMGDSFLFAWRLTDVDDVDQQKLTDLAIMACIRILANISKSDKLLEYACHENVVDRFGDDDFNIEVGLGLHRGWAIEGATGSEYKIDASYLSSHVTLASKLQEATMHYGANIILSDVVVSHASPEMAQYCRLIDQVAPMQKRQPPMRLYTVDLDPSVLRNTDWRSSRRTIRKPNRFRLRQIRESHKLQKWADTYNVWDAVALDYDIVQMRSPFTVEFARRFFTAYRNYEVGEWMVARDLFFTCHFQPKCHTPPVLMTKDDWPPDGPSRALLNFMQQYDYVAPADWPGFRELNTRGQGSLL